MLPEGSKPVAGTTDPSTDTSAPDNNSVCSTVERNGGAGFRVKKVAEINENISAADISPHNGTTRKRDNEVVNEVSASTSKRFRTDSTEERLEMTIVAITASSSSIADEACTTGEEQEAVANANDDMLQAESLSEREVSRNESVDEQKVVEAVGESQEVQTSTDTDAQPANIKEEGECEEEEAVERQIDDEPTPSSSCVTRTIDIKPAIKVEKADASSTSRESCKYGIRCYRRNPMHRIEEAHPGDHDYKRPSYSPPPDGAPDCPFGDSCYRRNPVHFQQYKHPPDTDFHKNYKQHRMRLRQRRQQQASGTNDDSNNASGNSSDLDDYDALDDPFDDDDDDSEYVPSNTENDDDEDYDECDKAEE